MTITDSEDNAQNCNIADVSETKKSIDISSLTEGSKYTLSIKELTGENGGILNEKTVDFIVAKLFDVKNILPSNNAIINAGEEASFSMALATHYELEKLELYIDSTANILGALVNSNTFITSSLVEELDKDTYYSYKAPCPSIDEKITMTRDNMVPKICVNNINVIAVSAASVFQIGNTDHIRMATSIYFKILDNQPIK